MTESTQNDTIYSNFRFAGFWIRLLAWIIDVILLIGLVFVVLFWLSDGYEFTESMEAIGNLLMFIFSYAYFVGLESSKWQATIGKRVFGLVVTDEYGNGASFGRVTGRYFSKIVSAMIIYIGFLMVGWTKKKQGLHDKMAGTLVIYKESTITEI